jgi:uncharacterized protein (DUF3084 family)
MPTKRMPNERHLAFREDLIALLRKYDDLRADEMLGVAAYFVGQLIALQDQRVFDSASVMQLVTQNIQAGNQQAVEQTFKDLKGSA